MYIYGLILGCIIVVLKVMDIFLNKKVMLNVKPKNHTMYRIIFVMPFLLVAAIINWELKEEAYGLLLLYSIAEAFNILFYQWSLSKLEPEVSELIAQSKIIMVLLVGIGMGLEQPTMLQIIGAILFIFGVILILELRIKKVWAISNCNKDMLLGILFQTISVVCRVIKPYVLKELMVQNLASNETVVFLSMPISLVVIYVIFKPKLDVKEINFKIYSIQALITGISMILAGYAVLYAGVLTITVTETFVVILLALINWLVYKSKLTVMKSWGLFIGVIGIMLVIIK